MWWIVGIIIILWAIYTVIYGSAEDSCVRCENYVKNENGSGGICYLTGEYINNPNHKTCSDFEKKLK